MDLEVIAAQVRERVPEVGVYPMRQWETVDFRMPAVSDQRRKTVRDPFRFTLTVDRYGDILGAWPCRTARHRLLMRVVADAVGEALGDTP